MPRNVSGLKRGGSPGRPKGVPNRATTEIKAACEQLLNDPVYRERLHARLLAGDLPPGMESLIWYYAYGKPKEQLEVNVPDPVTVINKFHGVMPVPES